MSTTLVFLRDLKFGSQLEGIKRSVVFIRCLAFADMRSRTSSEASRRISATDINLSPASHSQLNVGGVNLHLDASANSMRTQKGGEMPADLSEKATPIGAHVRCEAEINNEQALSECLSSVNSHNAHIVPNQSSSNQGLLIAGQHHDSNTDEGSSDRTDIESGLSSGREDDFDATSSDESPQEFSSATTAERN